MTGSIVPIGVGTAALYPRLAAAGSAVDTLTDPGDTNPPIIFEPPVVLSGGAYEVWLIASGGSDWGGCQVWISIDNATYALAGTIYRGARQGRLTASLPNHPDPDDTSTLSIDLTQSQGQLLSGTQADADNLVTLCYVDGELDQLQDRDADRSVRIRSDISEAWGLRHCDQCPFGRQQFRAFRSERSITFQVSLLPQLRRTDDLCKAAGIQYIRSSVAGPVRACRRYLHPDRGGRRHYGRDTDPVSRCAAGRPADHALHLWAGSVASGRSRRKQMQRGHAGGDGADT